MGILEKAKSRHRRALLIDDDRVSQFISRIIIEQLHLIDECIPYYNGATALQMLKQEQTMGLSFPDVIVLDLHMPVMDGFEFLQHLNERVELSFLLKRTLVLSSSICASDVAKVKKLGARWYLTKPLLSQELSPILTTVMQEREQEGAKVVGFESVQQYSPRPQPLYEKSSMSGR